MKGDGKE